MGQQRELAMVEDLVAAASKTLIAKGFHSVESGIQSVYRLNHRRLESCDVSARGFWLLFKDYVWESDAFHSLSVELTNVEYERQYSTLDPKIKHRFFNTGEVTPTNVLAYFH